MGLLVLDTTVLIDALRGRAAADRIRARGVTEVDVLLTTAINVEEIVRGVRPGEEAAVEQLFDGLRVLPIRRDEAVRAGRWRREFGQTGVTLHQADCLVAAAAVTAGARLATANVEDYPMPDLVVEQWPVDR